MIKTIKLIRKGNVVDRFNCVISNSCCIFNNYILIIQSTTKNKPVYVMCQSGVRSYIACRILTAKGYECYNFAGGYRFYDLVQEGINQSEEVFPCGMSK